MTDFPRLPERWPEIALHIKQAAGWKCERCGRAHDPLAHITLGVYRLDGDTANNADWNLAALCQRCGPRFRGRPLMGQIDMLDAEPWLTKHREGYLASLK